MPSRPVLPGAKNSCLPTPPPHQHIFSLCTLPAPSSEKSEKTLKRGGHWDFRYFGNFATSVLYFVISIQAVSVFIEFSTLYCGISRFFPPVLRFRVHPNKPMANIKQEETTCLLICFLSLILHTRNYLIARKCCLKWTDCKLAFGSSVGTIENILACV